MNKDIRAYNDALSAKDKQICDFLYSEIQKYMPDADNKIWHAHPVWFLEGNPIVGYSKLKDCVRLFFWSGTSFEEELLKPGSAKFKDASIRYTSVEQLNIDDLKRWLQKSRDIQWDYRNVIKRKGKLVRLK